MVLFIYKQYIFSLGLAQLAIVMKLKREGFFTISRIHQISDRLLSGRLHHNKTPFTSAQGRILHALWETDQINIHKLGQLTSLGKSTLTAMLDRLEKLNLIERKKSTFDRREILICLKTGTKSYQKSFQSDANDLHSMIYQNLSEKEVDAFERTLSTILKNLEHSQGEFHE